MHTEQDTITALSTPEGTGGIAVVRVSGHQAIEIVNRLFDGGKNLSKQPSHTAHVGLFTDKPKGETIDQVVATIFRKPHSYTGEDVVEISCHGGRYLAGLILERLQKQGARLAGPGEFTKRAFLNGKMDLAQAEAVADMIHAKTRSSLRNAIRQLKGRFSETVENIRNQILDLVANLELELDFAEEDLTILPKEEIMRRHTYIIDKLSELIRSHQKGRLIHDGVKVVIAGKPNVGKSSLFNVLLGYERAIVDEAPGTTRDAIEAQLDIEGTLFRIVDTAGLRKRTDSVEKKGIAITENQLEETDLILFMLDAGTAVQEEDRQIQRKVETVIEKKTSDSAPDVLVLLNKIDLKEGNSTPHFPNKYKWNVYETSMKTMVGVEHIHHYMANYIREKPAWGAQEHVVTSLRHKEYLKSAKMYMEKAKESLDSGMSNEFIAIDLRAALEEVGKIVGKTTTDDILDHIFSRFCIGK